MTPATMGVIRGFSEFKTPKWFHACYKSLIMHKNKPKINGKHPQNRTNPDIFMAMPWELHIDPLKAGPDLISDNMPKVLNKAKIYVKSV